jgi:hypothetical protein
MPNMTVEYTDFHSVRIANRITHSCLCGILYTGCEKRWGQHARHSQSLHLAVSLYATCGALKFAHYGAFSAHGGRWLFQENTGVYRYGSKGGAT